MSDTQSSQEYEVRVEQKMEAKLRDLLDRAKNITPFYDDDTLLNIYKDCFYTDQVFINKLEIIAKNHKNAKQEQDQDWIQFKQQQKGNNRHTRSGETTQNREKYHFLDDEELLERARHFDIQRQRDLWQRRKQERRQRQDNKYKQPSNKQRYQEKVQNQETIQNQKKLKFKQKVQQPKVTSTTSNPPPQAAQTTQNVETTKPTQAPQQVQQSSSKPAPKYAEKKQKFTEKKVEPTVPASNKKQEAPKQEPVDNKKQVKQPQKIRYQEKVQKAETTTKQQPKVEQQTQKATVPQPKQQSKVHTEQKVSEPIVKKIGSQKQLEPDVKREFEESCRLNSFILKFIPPTNKLQKISYIRDPNGSYREVKTREPLAK